MLQPPPANSLDSAEKTASSKKSSVRSSWNESRRKKISLAREMMEISPWIPKTALAKQFGIARSTLYRKPKQAAKDKLLLEQILEIMKDNRYYGKPRIADAMGRDIKLVKRIMEKYGLKPKKRRKRFRKPKDERRNASDIPNRIKNICAIAPNCIWVGDFTYLEFYGRVVYLATVLDRFTREVVGWSLGLHHSAQLVI